MVKMKIPPWLRPFFWDVDLETLDMEEHKIFIIERLLNEGDQHCLHWLFFVYSQEEIKEAVKTGRNLSPKTARCWQSYFGLREEEMRCFGRF